MLNDVSCVINAHREGNILFPTIRSVRRAVEYAQSCGLQADIHIVVDNPDSITKEIVAREQAKAPDLIKAHQVNFKDLAFSRNFAASQSTSKYMAFVDGDDLWSRNWVVDSFVMAERSKNPIVLHPEYNIFFGDETCHVFNHVDMDDSDFEMESLYRMNYWTALSFAETEIYSQYPYKKNTILDGFGYEDWTWNFETISADIKHKVVKGTVHFIRKGRQQASLLAQTNSLNAIPRIFPIYRSSEVLAEMDADTNETLAREVAKKSQAETSSVTEGSDPEHKPLDSTERCVLAEIPVVVSSCVVDAKESLGTDVQEPMRKQVANLEENNATVELDKEVQESPTYESTSDELGCGQRGLNAA